MKLHHLLILGIIFFAQISQAAYVEKIKGKKSLIILDGLSVNEGDMIEAIDPASKKKTAILKITTVKNDKAIAQIVRGKAKVNQNVQLRAAKSSVDSAEAMPTTREKTRGKKSSSSKSTFAVGGLLGVGMDKMDIILRDGSGNVIESLGQTGVGLSLMGAADMNLVEWFSIRAMAGVEQFNAKADSTQGASPCDSCETKITYFSAMGWGRAHVFSSIWLGLGLGIQHPLSTTTNALDESSIKTTIVYGIGGGADIELTDTLYIPVQLEYGMLPKSDDVESAYYGIRLGVMLRY